MSVIDHTFSGSIIPQEIQSNNNIQVYILGKAHWLAEHEKLHTSREMEIIRI